MADSAISEKGDHLLFAAKHRSLNAIFYLFGIDHCMAYSTLPTYCSDIVKRAHTIFHEGMNGVVFVDPFQFPEYCYYDSKIDLHFNWLQYLSPEQKVVAQNLIDYYFKTVKKQIHNVPKVETIRYWVIQELVVNIDYFISGDEIDYTLNYIRLQTGKEIIDLDKECILEHLKYAVKMEESRMVCKTTVEVTTQPSHFDSSLNTLVISLIKHVERILASGKRLNQHDDDSPEYTHQNFSRIVDLAKEAISEFDKEQPCSYITNRNSRWMECFNAYFKNMSTANYQELALVCGAGHLPDIIARLITDGFEISKVKKDVTVPIDMQTKSMLFCFMSEKNDSSHQIIKKPSSHQSELITRTVGLPISTF